MRKGIRYNSQQIYTLDTRLSALQADLKKVTDISTVIMRHVEKISSGYTRAKFSLDEITPFETNEEVKAFCVKDERREERRQALIDFMRLKGDDSSVTKYVYTLTRALFDPDYMSKVRWPSERYIYFIIPNYTYLILI